jgi:ATP-dependent protease HslVU (ClpYQ) peptidase subunit
MTIAAAFICLDGIVLAADSEYTYNYSKYEGEKLFQFGNDSWAIGIAAAGTMDLAKMFVSDLHRELQTETSVKASHVAIILRAKHFYDEYVRKNGEQDRQLLLLIAIQSKTSDENLLLKVNGDIVDPISQCDFIGNGDELARATASWIYHPHLPTDVATPVALNILYWTTQHAQFCGQSIYALRIR